MPTVQSFESPHDVARAMAAELTAIAESAVRLRGRCIVVLGLTPACLTVYRTWIAMSRDRAFWHYTIVFQSDEPGDRALALGRSAPQDEAALWEQLPVPRTQMHRMEREDDVDAWSGGYERAIRMALELRPGVDAEYDVAVLEVAPGGRLAGLSPEQWLGRHDGRIVVPSSDGASGITLSPMALANAEFLMLIAFGKDQRDAVAQWVDPGNPLIEPIRHTLASRPGSATIFMDRQASGDRLFEFRE